MLFTDIDGSMIIPTSTETALHTRFFIVERGSLDG